MHVCTICMYVCMYVRTYVCNVCTHTVCTACTNLCVRLSGMLPLHAVLVGVYIQCMRMYVHPVGEGGVCGLSEALLH